MAASPRCFRWAPIVPLLLFACGGPSPEQKLVDAAVESMGGEERIAQVAALVEEGEGRIHVQGMSHAPGAALPSRRLDSYRFAVDFPGARWRAERVSGAGDPDAPLSEQRVEGLDGRVAYDVTDEGDPIRLPEYEATNRRHMLYHHPLGALKAALANESRLSNLWRSAGRALMDVTTREGDRFTLFVDASSALPTHVRSLVYHPNLGDVVLETSFSAYGAVGGLMLPSVVTTRLDGDVISELRITHRELTASAGSLAAPEGVFEVPAGAGAIDVRQVAPGVWRLSGDTIDSVVIELAEYLVLVEAPGGSARTLAVIDEARQLVRGKPLRYLINTHHHFDHSAGIRAAVSEGLTVVTHERNRSFFEDIVRRPHTLAPDALARNPRSLALQEVSEKLVLQDELRRIEIHPVGPDPHASTMLMVYLPGERFLIRPGGMPGTLFEGSPSAQANRERLMRTIVALGLDVDYLLPLRGRVLAIEEVRSGTGLASDRPAAERAAPTGAGATTG